jgi:superfamily II DNA/RNA helicase
MSPDIRKLSEKFLKDPEFISVVMRETSKNIDQDVVRVLSRDKKIDQLHDILIGEQDSKILIFSETKRDVDRLARELVSRGFRVGAIHGDKRNRERVRTLEDFKTGRIGILIATDVAARGLDIPDVTHVINYDIPQTYDTYVHRIGRTGRAGKTGKALTFVH